MTSTIDAAKDFLVKAKDMTRDALIVAVKTLPKEVRSLFWKLQKDSFFVPENADIKCQRTVTSPSGKYQLVTTPYKTSEGCWSYTQGIVALSSDDFHVKPIAVVNRNYSSFEYSWIEAHANGHSYLTCGADYQGQTVVELDTGKVVDYVPAAAAKGFGFCWVGHHPSPDGTMMAIEGCFWACPYEVVIYDFADPMNPSSWLELSRDENHEDFLGWVDNDTARVGRRYRVLKSNGKTVDDLCADEYDQLDDDDLWEEKEDAVLWKRPTPYEAVKTYVNTWITWRKAKNVEIADDLLDMADRLIAKCNDEDKVRVQADFGDDLSWARAHARNETFDGD